jgi:hypothetical protein
MSHASERKLAALEAFYSELLLSALQRCAAGRWGLFGHNDAAIDRLDAGLQNRLRDPAVTELLDLGISIEKLRRQLGHIEAFPLHERLLRMRSSHHANSPGEPKLARQWLDEMLPKNAID